MRPEAIYYQEGQVWVTSGGTVAPARHTPITRQMPLSLDIDKTTSEGRQIKFVGGQAENAHFLNTLRLMHYTSSTTEPAPLSVLKKIVDALDEMHLLENIYGYVADEGCEVVGIANELSDEEQDSLWDIAWDFKGKYPRMDIEVLLINRHGRPLSELYNGDSAVVERTMTPA